MASNANEWQAMQTNDNKCFPSAIGKNEKIKGKCQPANDKKGCNVNGVKISYNSSL